MRQSQLYTSGRDEGVTNYTWDGRVWEWIQLHLGGVEGVKNYIREGWVWAGSN